MPIQRNLPNLGLLNRLERPTSGWGVDLNADLAQVDALSFLAVLDVNLTTPPADPQEGDRYIVAVGATGGWVGQDAAVAAYVDGAWVFYPPRVGWTAYNALTGRNHRFEMHRAWQLVESPYDILAYIAAFGSTQTDPVFSLLLRRAVRFPAGLVGSAANARVAAMGLSHLPMLRNGVQVGSVNFPAGSVEGNFTFDAEVTFAAGDVLDLMPTPDPGLKGVRLSLVGYR